MKEKTYAIIGLGFYGKKIADTLSNAGASIMVADNDADLINSIARIFTYAVSLDLGNGEAVSEIGLQNADVAVIDLASNLEQAIICTMIAKEQGVKDIIATAKNKRCKEILKKMGANEVIIPEEEAALRMARTLISDDFLEYIDIGRNLCAIKVHPLHAWVGKTITQLKLRTKYHVTVIAIEIGGELVTDFDKNYVFREDTVLILALDKERVMDFIEA